MRLALLLAALPGLALAHEGPHSCLPAAAALVGDAATLTVEVPTLVYFGFASCPDVCPLDLSRNAEAVRLAREHGVTGASLFVSVDPSDAAEEVDGFVANWPGTEGRTAAPALEAALRVFAEPRAGAPDLWDHSSLTYLAAPGLGVVALAGRSRTPTEVAELLICLAPPATP
jgi:protein SCO1/2